MLKLRLLMLLVPLALGRRVVDLREECEVESQELSCLREGSGMESEYLLRNDSQLFVEVRDLSHAKRFEECIVFGYLNWDHFSYKVAPFVVELARTFPHVVFVQVEGYRAGYVLGGILPKYFPALVHLKGNRATVFDGNLRDLAKMIEFVAFATGEGPLTWNPSHHVSFSVPDFVHPPDEIERSLVLFVDPFFVFSVLFISISTMFRLMGST